ncbi:hypothetical protein BJ912DRAFT_999223 [Pholiota molesta]|nr:hypothetical protein BJ912DRAFT_999223 [Pholiota molesta]
MSATTFIDPAALTFTPPSPAPSSSYTHDDDEDAGPSRKRQRTADSNDTTKELSVSEQRKEARAHRNRIAAQNSRDRRKAQFTYLERRVAELEEENRRLRAGIQVPPAAPSPAQVPATGFASQVALSSVLEDRLRAERERERERENQELKERIRTLERGWDAVVKALAAQGLPTGLTVSTAQPEPAQITAPVAIPTQQPTTTQPAYTAFPSPAPSNASLDFDLSISAPSTTTTTISPLFAAPAPQPPTPAAQTTDTHTHTQTTRHLAAGGLGRVSAPVSAGAATQGDSGAAGDSDTAMEALFREILASPRAQHAVAVRGEGAAQVTAAQSGAQGAGESEQADGPKDITTINNTKTDTQITTVKEAETEEESATAVAEWAHEIEMQRMLDDMVMMHGGGLDMGMDPLGLGAMDIGVVDIGLGMGIDMDFGIDMPYSLDHQHTGSGAGAGQWDGTGVGVF